MSELKIHEKCWSFNCADDHYYTGHVYGKTLSKAKYKFYLEQEDYDFFEFIKSYKFKRCSDMDLVESLPMGEIKDLTHYQLHIICHANGNNSEEPGYRSYFNSSNKDDTDLSKLVELGFMHEPQTHCGGGSFNFFLTKLGKLAAMSVLPIQKDKVQGVINERTKILEWQSIKELDLKSGASYDMHMFKQNPKLRTLMSGVSVYIRSCQWGAYWGPNGSGYTEYKDNAGVYNFDEAYLDTQHCGEEKGIHFQII